MNILFISRLSNNNNCGPYYSIPRQVAAQRIYDNVFWLNANNNYFEEWEKIGEVKTQLPAIVKPEDFKNLKNYIVIYKGKLRKYNKEKKREYIVRYIEMCTKKKKEIV